MKRFLQKAVCLILLFLLALPAKAYASNGSGNMDGGGSGMGQGTSTNYWTPGYDGVRIWPVLPLNLPVVLMYIRFQLLPCPIL